MRRLSHTSIVGVVAVALSVPATATADNPAGSCRAAAALESAHLLSDARAQYVKALALGECESASGALSAIAADQARARLVYRRGVRAEASGDLAVAVGHYRSALGIDRGLDDARTRLEGLAKADAPGPDRFQELGDRADDAFEDLGDVASWLGFWAALTALVAVALLVFGRLPFISSVGRRFGELSRSRPATYKKRKLLNAWMRRGWRSAWFRVRRIANGTWGVSVRVEGFEKAEDGSVHRTVQGLLGGTASLGDTGVDLATGAGGSDFVDEIGTAIKATPQGKLLGAVLSLSRKVLPRDAFVLRLHPLTAEGELRGAAVALATGRNVVRAADVLWEDDFSGYSASHADVVPPPVLAIATAAWADYAMLDHRGRQAVAEAVRGTRDWRSYALFRVGVEYQRLGQIDAAQSVFARSLDRDPHNTPARFNLAVCDSRRLEFEQAERRLRSVERDVDERYQARKAPKLDVGGFPMRDPLWYSAVHNRAAAEYALPHTNHADIEDRLRAMLKALQADREALKLLESDRGQRWPARCAATERLRLLDRIEGPALVLWASGLAHGNTEQSRYVNRLEVPHPDALRILVSKADDARLPDPREASTDSVSPRTAYALACFFTVKETESGSPASRQAIRQAFDYLREAAEDPGLAAWARHDPTLRELRAHVHASRFEDAVGRRLRADAELPLAMLRIVGPSRARSLADRGISSAAQLVAAARVPSRREAIATELGVSPLLVERWTRLAELSLRLNLEPWQADLLDAARSASVGALARADAATLQALLTDLIGVETSAHVAPTEAEVVQWIEAAKKRPSTIMPQETAPLVAAAQNGKGPDSVTPARATTTRASDLHA